MLTRDHRLPFSTLWHTNTTSIENFDGVVPPSPPPPSSQRLPRPTSSKSRTFLPGKRRERKKGRKEGKGANSPRIRQFLRSFAATSHRSVALAAYGHPVLRTRCREFILSEIAGIFDRLERVSIARRMEFLVSDNYNEGNSFRGSFRNALRCFSGNVKRLAILARGSENRGNVRLQAFVRVIKRRSVAVSSLFSKPCKRFNCGEKKKERGRESTAKKRDWQLLLRFRATKMCGRGDRGSCWKREWKFNWPSRDRRRANEPSMAHPIERKSRQTDFIPLSFSLCLDFSKRTDVKMVVLLAYPARFRVKE